MIFSHSNHLVYVNLSLDLSIIFMWVLLLINEFGSLHVEY